MTSVSPGDGRSRSRRHRLAQQAFQTATGTHEAEIGGCSPGSGPRCVTVVHLCALLVEMRVHAVLIGCVLGLGAAVGVVSVLARLWNSCGIGINAGANSLTLLFLYAPAVAFSAGASSAVVFSIVARPASSRWRTIGYGAAAVVTFVVGGLALFIGSDFGADYPCPALARSDLSTATHPSVLVPDADA